MQIFLIGEEKSERTDFFVKAANALGAALRFVQFPNISDLMAFDFSALANRAVKIDPPNLDSVYIDELDAFGQRYSCWLEKMQGVLGIKCLNEPRRILRTFDKISSKRALLDAGISTAPFYPEVRSLADLRDIMSKNRLHSVFIKPRFGSGASGIVALRRNPATLEEIAYTTVRVINKRLCNTQNLRCIRQPEEIAHIADNILNMGALVEKWIPKATTSGKTYDIRVVWQFGKIEYAVARLAKRAITNLHLGGDAVNIDELRLDNQTLYEIENLCRGAMSCFPGLNVAGIDILLEQNTYKPYIIEINGQGDLLYKDIHGENMIYKSQLIYLNSLLRQKDIL
jgi:glutathione synthase/RimK-type ligase-like ATP-grasp enzyme